MNLRDQAEEETQQISLLPDNHYCAASTPALYWVRNAELQGDFMHLESQLPALAIPMS